MNNKKYIKSPLNYTGGKYRLLKKIIPLFPKDIDTFMDLFAGASTVGINVNANEIICNDYIKFLPELFNTWKEKDITDTNLYIDSTIDKWDLSKDNKESFLKFREYYNKNRNIEDLFILSCYSFNYQLRFNKKHEFNGSFGKDASTMNPSIRNNLNAFINIIKEKDIKFLNKDFRFIKNFYLDSDDFVYCDPPYLISTGVYQDGKRGFKGWNQEDDLDLMDILDHLNKNNIRWAMSNAFENKNIKNEKLIEWATSNYNVHYLNMNYNGSNYQRKESKTTEVLITNY